MAKYKVTLQVDGSRIDVVRKQVAAAFPDQVHQVDKINLFPSRADRLADAEALVNDAVSIVEELANELEEWHDGMPENLKSSSKADELQEAMSELGSIKDELEGIDFSTVNFPGMN